MLILFTHHLDDTWPIILLYAIKHEQFKYMIMVGN